MVNSTHGTNNRRYKLFSFVVHDLNGKVCEACDSYVWMIFNRKHDIERRDNMCTMHS